MYSEGVPLHGQLNSQGLNLFSCLENGEKSALCLEGRVGHYQVEVNAD